MSRTARKTLRNTVVLALFELANPLLSLLLIGTISRVLGAEGLGAYNLLLAFFFIVQAFTSLGLRTLITREVSRSRERALHYLSSSVVLGLVSSLLGAVGFLLILRLARYGGDVEAAGWLIALALIPSIVITYGEAIFIAYEKIQCIVYVTMGENIARVLVGLWILHAGGGVTALIASFAFLRFVALVAILIFFHRHISPLAWRHDSSITRDLARHIPVFGTILILTTLYTRLDVLLLSKMATLAAVGYYTAAYRLFAISRVVPKSFETALYPVLSKLFAQAPEKYRKAKSLAIRYILVAVLPVSAGISGLAAPIVLLLFGRGFEQAGPVLAVVIWTLVPYGVTKVLASSLIASDRQVVDLKVNALGLTANIILNVALIPYYGALGCAWATLLSRILFLACQIFFLRREIFPILRQAEIVRPGMAAAAILLWLHYTPAVPLPLRIAGGGVIYGLLVLLLRVIQVSDLRLVLPERFHGILPH